MFGFLRRVFSIAVCQLPRYARCSCQHTTGPSRYCWFSVLTSTPPVGLCRACTRTALLPPQRLFLYAVLLFVTLLPALRLRLIRFFWLNACAAASPYRLRAYHCRPRRAALPAWLYLAALQRWLLLRYNNNHTLPFTVVAFCRAFAYCVCALPPVTADSYLIHSFRRILNSPWHLFFGSVAIATWSADSGWDWICTRCQRTAHRALPALSFVLAPAVVLQM